MKINQFSKCAGIGVFFLFANLNAQSSETVIKDFIKNDVTFRNSTNIKVEILNESRSEHLKVQIVNVQQYHENTPIYQLLAKAIIRDGKVVSFNNNFHKSNYNVVGDKINKNNALSTTLNHLKINGTDFKLMDENDGDLINLTDDKVASARF